MPKYRDYIFVLWADKFEEATASIFVTELREAGLRVKVVGLTPRHIHGSHGLALMPDFTLDQALPLASQTICLIIPNTTNGLMRLKNDPRLCEFFDRAYANQAKFVIGQSDKANIAEMNLFAIWTEDQIIVYPDNTTLVEFARELASSLLAN